MLLGSFMTSVLILYYPWMGWATHICPFIIFKAYFKFHWRMSSYNHFLSCIKPILDIAIFPCITVCIWAIVRLPIIMIYIIQHAWRDFKVTSITTRKCVYGSGPVLPRKSFRRYSRWNRPGKHRDRCCWTFQQGRLNLEVLLGRLLLRECYPSAQSYTHIGLYWEIAAYKRMYL